MLGEDVAYQWRCDHSSPGEHTIRCLWVWHWCDHHLWVGREGYDANPGEYVRWMPTGVGAHDLISVDPLHIEASVYWPDCCGMHGFIRGGQWASV